MRIEPKALWARVRMESGGQQSVVQMADQRQIFEVSCLTAHRLVPAEMLRVPDQPWGDRVVLDADDGPPLIHDERAVAYSKQLPVCVIVVVVLRHDGGWPAGLFMIPGNKPLRLPA